MKMHLFLIFEISGCTEVVIITGCTTKNFRNDEIQFMNLENISRYVIHVGFSDYLKCEVYILPTCWQILCKEGILGKNMDIKPFHMVPKFSTPHGVGNFKSEKFKHLNRISSGEKFEYTNEVHSNLRILCILCYGVQWIQKANN